jgi:hypothetical protein
LLKDISRRCGHVGAPTFLAAASSGHFASHLAHQTLLRTGMSTRLWLGRDATVPEKDGRIGLLQAAGCGFD